MAYSVIVGNIGMVCDRANHKEATDCYQKYVDQSKSKQGRAGHEPVTILLDGEPVKEYYCDCKSCRELPRD